MSNGERSNWSKLNRFAKPVVAGVLLLSRFVECRGGQLIMTARLGCVSLLLLPSTSEAQYENAASMECERLTFWKRVSLQYTGV